MTLESRLDAWSRGWRGPLLAALVAMIAGLPGVFAMPPLDRDESRFAQATAQMLETGDFVNIRFQDQPRNKKPVGIHWLQAISVSAVSDVADREIWAYRLPSLLGAMLAAAACAWGAAVFFGPRLGLFAGALLGASFLLSTEAFIAKTDAVLAGTVTLAMAAMARMYFAERGGPSVTRRTRLLFWLGVAGATLVKGPVGPLVVILAALALWAWDRDGAWLKKIGWGWGLVLFFAVVGPWAVAITVATDGSFWGSAVAGDLAPKLAGGHERHGGPFGYHTFMSFLLIFPASLLLPAALVRGWRDRIDPGVKFALCWLIPTWLLFEILPTKLVHYTLPAYGALAWMMANAMRQPLSRPLAISGAVLSVLAAAVFAVISIYGLSQFGDDRDLTWAAVTAALFAAAGIVGAYMVLRRAAASAVIATGALGVLAHAAFAGGLAPSLEPIWLSREVAEELSDTGLSPREGVMPGPVEVAGYAEPSLVFALGTNTGLGGAQDAAQAILQGRPAVVESREEPAFRQALAARGLVPRAAGAVSGLDYTNGDEMTLTLYRGVPQRTATPEPLP
ncbi:MAG TPA: glycosyltransferase family 39 protein [Caulobacteraceae bacterium]|nr:glycosyltransferase family 39 protein [Caulobacteraceae bacterium]